MSKYDINFFGVIHQSGGCGPELLGALDLLQKYGVSARCILPMGDMTAHGDRAAYLSERGIPVVEYSPGMFSKCDILMSFGEDQCFQYMWSFSDRPKKVIWSSCMAWVVDKEVWALDAGLIDEFFYQTPRNGVTVGRGIALRTGQAPNSRAGYFPFIDANSTFGSYGKFVSKSPREFKVCKAVRDDPEKWDADSWRMFSSVLVPSHKTSKFEIFGFGPNAQNKIGDPCDISSKWSGCFDLSWRSHVTDPVEVAKLYGSSHVLLHFYPFIENYPRATLEAMLSGAVPVAAPEGGFLDQIEHGKTGFFVTSIDEAAYFVSKLAFEDSLCARMGKTAREWVLRDGPGNPDKCWPWWSELFPKKKKKLG